MRQINILWADDEIELLKPHILFLEAKGYAVHPVNNGNDAIAEVSNQNFDIVFLDEQMPGLNGIEVLESIKAKHPELPVIMITKSEEENIMDKAIGSQINDYLIKPINPNQILLALKKNLNKNDLLSQNMTMKYQRDFSQLGMEIANARTHEDWIELYRHLVYWEMQLEQSKDHSMNDLLLMQKNDANVNFANQEKLCVVVSTQLHRKTYLVTQYHQGKSPSRNKERPTNLVARARQSSLRPLDCPSFAFERILYRDRRFALFQHFAHNDAICTKLPVFGTYACRYRKTLSRTLGGRRRRRDEKSSRRRNARHSTETTGLQRENLFRQNYVNQFRKETFRQDLQDFTMSFFGFGAQFHRYSFARTNRNEHD